MPDAAGLCAAFGGSGSRCAFAIVLDLEQTVFLPDLDRKSATLCMRVANDVGHAFTKRKAEHVLLCGIKTRCLELRGNRHPCDHERATRKLELIFQALRAI